MTLYEIFQMIVHSGPQFVVLLLIIMSLIEITPIKVNPWKALAKAIGRGLNADTNERIDKMNTELNEKMEKITTDYNDRCDDIKNEVTTLQDELHAHVRESEARELRDRRNNILNFASAIAQNREFTREKYNQMLRECDEYEQYCEEKDFKNSVAMASMAMIKHSYEQHLLANDFLATAEYDASYSDVEE